jgi:hypothetical protein
MFFIAVAMFVSVPIPIPIPIAIPNVDFFRRSVFVFFIFVVTRLPDNMRWPMMGFVVVVTFTISGDIHLIIPAVVNKIDRPATGIVPVAVLIPSLGMTRRYPEVDRGIPRMDAMDNDRFRIEQAWHRIAADVDTPVKSGFPNADRDSGLGLINRHCQ